MKASEKYKPQFVRPKTMFKRKEFKKVVKGKVFGVTLSTGAQRLWHVPSPFTQHDFARLVDQKLGPFLAAAFPQHSRRVILLDGEPLLHAPAAVAAMERNHMVCLREWPAYSPDLNPQENVWPWIEKELRKQERKSDSFADFKRRLTRAQAAYPNGSSLIPSMAERVRKVLAAKGAMTKH